MRCMSLQICINLVFLFSLINFSRCIEKPTVTFVYSPNYSERNCSTCTPPYVIDGVAIHTTEETLERTFEIFESSSSQASAHYVIANNGSIYQMVYDVDRAWTTTYVNSRTIGIELVAWSGDQNSLTYPLIGSLVQLVSWLVDEYNISLRHPNTTAFDFPVKTEYGYYNETGLYGHFQVQTCGSNATQPKDAGGGGYSCKTDPGPFFPWNQLMYDVSLLLNKPIEAVPTKSLRYDCVHTTSIGETLAGIASFWKINYWQEICLYNEDVIGDYCGDECIIFAQCDPLPSGLTLIIPSVVVDYFPECTTLADNNQGYSSEDIEEENNNNNDDASLLSELEVYQILFFLMIGVNSILLMVVIVLVFIVIKRTRTQFYTIDKD